MKAMNLLWRLIQTPLVSELQVYVELPEQLPSQIMPACPVDDNAT